MSPTDPSRPLDDLVFRYLERVDEGEEGAGVLAELVAAHPDQAEALRRGVALLRETHLHPDSLRDGVPLSVGPFRLQRRLGEGGMGVVYLAEQEHPRRRVALKLVRPDQLYFEGARDRFEREVQSVARLSHPGIASVLEVGEHDGVPWFSQELVVGASLSEILSALPPHVPEALRGADARRVLADLLATEGEALPASEWNDAFFEGPWVDVVLRVVQQVGEALQHAHERGVLHRDVKPSNVILTPGGRAVLVDFGLASLRGTSRLTRTGAQLGSLHYMSPEQLDGRIEELGPASDVYSLGVTLFELLTLRAPYTSKSVERLRTLILGGEAPPVRKLNPAAPRDAAVVCATAMDPSLARRYVSAAAFAGDVAAVREHRPIRARPAGLGLRGLRWCQRHPARAVAAVAGFLLLVVAPTAFAVQRTLAAGELRAVNGDLADALETSQANLRSATQAVERVMRWAAEDGLDDVPGMLELRAQVVAEALEVFAGLRETRPDDRDLLFEQARLFRTQGTILNDLSRNDEAAGAFEAAVERLAPEARATDRLWLSELSLATFGLAQTLGNAGRHAESIPHYRASLEALRSRIARAPDAAPARRDFAQGAAEFAHALLETEGPTPEAGAILEEALSVTTALVARAPEVLPHLTAHAAVLESRGAWKRVGGDWAGAEEDFEAACVALERALALDPQDRFLRWNSSKLLRARGAAANRLQAPERAEPLLQRALERIEEVRRENPGVAEYDVDRIAVLGELAGVQRARGDLAGAYDSMQLLGAELLESAAERPDDAPLQRNAAVLQLNLANIALNDGGRGEARYDLVLEHCRTADALLLGLSDSARSTQDILDLRMMVVGQQGAAQFWREDAEGLARALADFEALGPARPLQLFQLACLWRRRFQLTEEDGDRGETLEWTRRAVEAGFADLRAFDSSALVAILGGEEVAALRERVRARAASE